MKIAYVSCNMMPSTLLGGVGKKINSVVQTWNNLGHDAHWFYSGSAELITSLSTSFIYNPCSSVLIREKERAIQLNGLLEALKRYCPDIIYLRSGIYTYPLHKLFTIAPVIIELNTLDLVEYWARGLFRYGLHRLTRNLIYSQAAGFVAVSNEIGNHKANTKYSKEILISGNGINFLDYNLLPAPKGNRPRLVFMGTAGNKWHGVDKILWLANQCPDFNFDLIGIRDEGSLDTRLANVNFHGQLNKEEYIKILLQADVAIGTLALHRNNMNEASPLKVREYLACGIPIIIAYDDTDLRTLETGFILKIENSENNVQSNLDRIRAFAFAMQGKRADVEKVKPYIDQDLKEKERLLFFAHLLENK